jgi:outer membrane immunogenic protein
MMKKLLFGSIVFVALNAASATLAADMPVKAPVYKALPVVAYNWTGFYVGGHAGYGWAFPEITLPPSGVAVINPPRPRGILGGVQAGYNWQSGPLVLGVEGEFTWSGVAGSSNAVVPGGIVNARGEPDEYATIAARAGYAVDRSLFFVKGGAAWLKEGFRHLSVTIPTCTGTPCTGSNSTWGWTVGAGLEYAFDPHWAVKLEYTYLDFGHTERVIVTNGVTSDIFDATRTFHLVKLGVNYKFDWGAPVVAKY